jgi:hypothetical protein
MTPKVVVTLLGLVAIVWVLWYFMAVPEPSGRAAAREAPNGAVGGHTPKV